MIHLEWVKEFEIGNESVDIQHRYFLGLINRIGKTFRESNDKAQKGRLWSELYKYADFHFTSEENLAMSQGVENVDQHHRLHLDLLENLNLYRHDLNSGEKTIDDFLEFITDWFLVHTMHEDRKLFKAK
jgi:hemerythrin